MEDPNSKPESEYKTEVGYKTTLLFMRLKWLCLFSGIIFNAIDRNDVVINILETFIHDMEIINDSKVITVDKVHICDDETKI